MAPQGRRHGLAWPGVAFKLAGMDDTSCTAFIGGGNMASAILGGLLHQGAAPSGLIVVEPFEPQRAKLFADFGLTALPAADASLARASTVVWAVKPQLFKEAAAPCAAHVADALHLSIMAGIRSDTIVAATGSARVVRAMPNTPALIGRGIAGLFARAGVSATERAEVERLLKPTGSTLWVDDEADLDAVTALSGSGPAYVFYVIEAMVQAGVEMGLAPAQARRLAQETLAGAAMLAMQSEESPALLRERVTSKGGTTHAAITSMEDSGVKAAIVKALHAARTRAEELGRSA
jgi:pyrroline-5-carboxylate reductase